MKMRLLTLLMAAGLAFGALAPEPSYALDKDEKAKLAGAIIGIAIAKKVAEDRAERKARGEPYRVNQDVICFPEIRKCYWKNRYSWRYTEREFY